MKVTLTGSSGNIGRRIANTLERRGHEVLHFSRRSIGKNWVHYELGDDPRLLPWDGVDALIHCAHDFTPRDLQSIIERNVTPSISLFQAATEANVLMRIFVSSLSSFDTCRSLYGKAKRKIEMEIMASGGIVVRPGLVWGGPSGVMASLERAVQMAGVVPFPAGGNTTQYMIHVDDLAEAIVRLSEQPAVATHSKLVSYAHPKPMNLHDILRVIARREKVTRLFLPVPWPLINTVLKAAEAAHISLPFRSDSLIGLVHGLPTPTIDSPLPGITIRPFE